MSMKVNKRSLPLGCPEATSEESPAQPLQERVSKSAKKVRFNDEATQIHLIDPNQKSSQIRVSSIVQDINEEGDQKVMDGDLEKALRTYKHGLNVLSWYFRPHPAQKAELHFGIGVVLFDLRRFEESLSAFEASYAIEHEDTELLKKLCCNLGVVHKKLGQYEKALEFFLKAQTLQSEPDPKLQKKIADLNERLSNKAGSQ